MEVRTRMAPSPTGNLHIGTAYATMWPYIFARHNRGKFILRFEDTDRERSTKEFEENIEKGLVWLGFEWDEGPYHQIDRIDVYKKYSDQLVNTGKSYFCFCTKEELEQERKVQSENKQQIVYSGRCRNLSKDEVEKNIKEGKPYAIRFKMPDDRGAVEFEDMIHGKVSIDSALIGDTIILRPNGVPLYNFAVVVDDIEMKITHVIRGDDHISNTPKQILFYEAFGYPLPKFGHTPMILNQDRIGKLSKRTGSTSVDSFRLDGYLPKALFNYIALLGWTPKDGQEIFTKEELIEKFDISDVGSSGAAWNQEKLDWMNGEYIRKMSDEELADTLKDFFKDVLGTQEDQVKIEKLAPLVKERMKTLRDFELLTTFIFESVEYDKKVFERLNIKNQKEALEKVLEKFEGEKSWDGGKFEQTFQGLAKELGISNLDMFQLIRVAISGQLVTPPLFESIEILGIDEVKARVKKALDFIQG